jgi:hypothetical protein
MSKTTLKEKIQNLEKEIEDLKVKKEKKWKIKRCEVILSKLVLKRDEIFARHKAKKNNNVLLRDIAVASQQRNKEKKIKKVHENIYLKDLYDKKNINK